MSHSLSITRTVPLSLSRSLPFYHLPWPPYPRHSHPPRSTSPVRIVVLAVPRRCLSVLSPLAVSPRYTSYHYVSLSLCHCHCFTTTCRVTYQPTSASASSTKHIAGECPSHPLCRVQSIAFHQSRSSVYSPSRDDPCTRCLSQPTTSSHCLALTLSRSTRSHTVSLYLVLTLSHVRFRTSCHMVSSSVNVSHRLALFRIHLTVCHATGQFNAPTLSHAHFDAPFNAQVTRTVAAPTVAAHTLLRQPQLHY